MAEEIIKDLRTKIILTLSIVSTVIAIWTWIQNVNNIDIAATKNRHYQSQLRLQIKSSNDPVFIKEKALSFLDTMNELREEKNRTASDVNKSLVWLVVVSVLTTIITTIELIKRRAILAE
jgi:hypothetical protein